MISWIFLGVLLLVLLYVLANKDTIITEHLMLLGRETELAEQLSANCMLYVQMQTFHHDEYRAKKDANEIPKVCLKVLGEAPLDAAPEAAPEAAPDAAPDAAPEAAPEAAPAPEPVAQDAGAPLTTDDRVSNIEAQMSTISARLGIANPNGPPPADLVELSKKYNKLAAELKDMREKSEKGMAQAKEAQDKLNAIATS